MLDDHVKQLLDLGNHNLAQGKIYEASQLFSQAWDALVDPKTSPLTPYVLISMGDSKHLIGDQAGAASALYAAVRYPLHPLAERYCEIRTRELTEHSRNFLERSHLLRFHVIGLVSSHFRTRAQRSDVAKPGYSMDLWYVVRPPWIEYPRIWAGPRGLLGGTAHRWLVEVFLPFWAIVPEDQRADYIKLWPTEEGWEHFLR